MSSGSATPGSSRAGDADDEAVDALRGLDDPSDPAQVTSALRPARTLGPGELAYLPVGAQVADLDHAGDVREVAVASLRGWLGSLTADDVAESSVAEMEQVLALCRGEDVLGAGGNLVWPADIGHVGVLVAPSARGAGVGTCLGAAATRRVLDRGLTPQWRAASSNDASRRVAHPACVGDIGTGGSDHRSKTVSGPLGRTVREVACESVGHRATFEDDNPGGT